MNRARSVITAFFLVFLFGILAISCTTSTSTTTVKPVVSKEGQTCLDCHKTATAGVVTDWLDSKHATKGTDCFTCHGATGKGDRPDIIDHNGFKIVVLVTPKDCQILPQQGGHTVFG